MQKTSCHLTASEIRNTMIAGHHLSTPQPREEANLHVLLFFQVQFKVDMWTFPISFGIVIFSYTSQIFLPTLEGNLVDRSQFTTMLHWTHVAAAVFKSLFSYIGTCIASLQYANQFSMFVCEMHNFASVQVSQVAFCFLKSFQRSTLVQVVCDVF